MMKKVLTTLILLFLLSIVTVYAQEREYLRKVLDNLEKIETASYYSEHRPYRSGRSRLDSDRYA